jgi:hypothetical protein
MKVKPFLVRFIRVRIDPSHVKSDRLITHKSVSGLVLFSILTVECKPARWWSREILISLRKKGKKEGEVHVGDQWGGGCGRDQG